MPAGNETNNFVRDGSMLPHHDIDTTTTPNSWKPTYPYVTHYTDGTVTYYQNGKVRMAFRASLPLTPTEEYVAVTLPVAVSNPANLIFSVIDASGSTTISAGDSILGTAATSAYDVTRSNTGTTILIAERHLSTIGAGQSSQMINIIVEGGILA